MALREKTVQFAFPTITTLVANATVTNLDQITIFIPESNPTFTSVNVEVGFFDVITDTGGTIDEHRVGLRLGPAAYTTITETDDIVHTAENIGGVLGPFDFTTHFNTNWTGTSMTCDLQVYFDQNTGTTLGMTNVTGIINITYTYDDTVSTQIKTVKLPMESITGALPTTRDSQFGNQVPQLTGAGGLLPEAGVNIRDYYFVVEGNTTLSNSTTNTTLNIGLDDTDTFTFATTEGALASDIFGRWIWKPTVIPDTTVDHLLQLWSTTVGRYNHITITLVVTYEFTLSGTTRVLNSILIPIEMSSPLGANTTSDASRVSRDIFIVEPGSITMRHSAFRINWNFSAGAGNIYFRCGTQSYRVYTTAGNLICGMMSLQQRFDSGSVQGAGLTLQRGKNTIIIDGYGTSISTQLTNLNGYILLNYESDLSSEGIGAHSHTIYKTLSQWDALLQDRLRIDNYSVPIVESSYFLISTGFCLIMWTRLSANGITFNVECLAGENKQSGYISIYDDVIQTDNEQACSMIYMQARSLFKRFPNDSDTDRLDIETPRNYRLFTPIAAGSGIYSIITYHSITWNISGDITGNDPSLTTQLSLVRESSGEILQKATLAAGVTTFNFTVYDNTENYYVVAYQDNTLVGRSGIGKAV